MQFYTDFFHGLVTSNYLEISDGINVLHTAVKWWECLDDLLEVFLLCLVPGHCSVKDRTLLLIYVLFKKKKIELKKTIVMQIIRDYS